MKHIVFDLEFNSPFKINRKTNQLARGNTIPLCPQEIIEIGAVKTNDKIEIEDTFKIFIKPQLYTKLHPKVKKKTQITIEELYGGFPIEEGIEHFKEWIGEEDFFMCSWGVDDINELKRNCIFFGINTDWINKCCDIQKMAMKHFNLPKGRQIGLKNAVELFNLDIDSRFHKALNDAIYTVKILKELRKN
ncbi:Inhibitor of the KinA pathway to sporulation, predicted exonuclease [Natronincola peptidivorans]|uniref:Inhibitor of the KinA pathway to sporulation, predicted exonuclease n=1 Tax=Natronincola peptidivorans TaxID=426128 RepID=A0A1I0F5L8_9FIRM|nr:3'-5' exonuclease [Natronincola peptidivorans]SET52982.1 Inhibitor of the KinA pathway to sporulation, predicted exonuclease [Natronincola peptidivorans]